MEENKLDLYFCFISEIWSIDVSLSNPKTKRQWPNARDSCLCGVWGGLDIRSLSPVCTDATSLFWICGTQDTMGQLHQGSPLNKPLIFWRGSDSSLKLPRRNKISNKVFKYESMTHGQDMWYRGEKERIWLLILAPQIGLPPLLECHLHWTGVCTFLPAVVLFIASCIHVHPSALQTSHLELVLDHLEQPRASDTVPW